MAIKRLAVIGDLHLGKLDHKVDGHLGLQIHCLNKITTSIREHGLKSVVLLGDVFDKPSVTPTIVIEILRFFLKNKDLSFDWVMGNHDRTSKAEATVDILNELTTLDALPNLTIHNEPTSRGGVGFLPFPHKKPLKNTVLSFAHVDRPGARMDTGRVLSDKGEWDDKHIFVIGHIHTAQTVGKKSHYTGAPWQLSFGEQGPKHWAIVSFDPKDPKAFRYEQQPIPPVYEMHNITVNSKKQLKGLKPHPVYYKITLDGVKLPPNFLAKNPNCEVRGFIMKRDDKAKVLVSDKAIDVKLTYKLTEFMAKKGLSEKETEWGFAFAEKALRKAGLLEAS